jgi:hypothetical protein
MPLTCSCETDGSSWYWFGPRTYSAMPPRKRRFRCSCGTFIDTGATVAEFARARPPRDSIESNIYGEDGEIAIPSLYLCERCADIWFSLYELGFECCAPTENMLDLAAEYAVMAAEYRRTTNA